MMKKTKQFVTTFLIAATIVGTGAIPAYADAIPNKVSLPQSQRSVAQGKKFELKARTTPYDAEDDYICWEIVSGEDYVMFEDYDQTGDDMDFIAVKPGTATIRCYVYGKKKTTSGDTITITVTKSKSDYSLKRGDAPVKYEDVWDDFDLEVKAGRSIKNSELKWEIKDPSILSFATGIKTGREVEFYAKKIGKTTVTCSYTNSKGEKKSVTYTVKVVADYDD